VDSRTSDLVGLAYDGHSSFSSTDLLPLMTADEKEPWLVEDSVLMMVKWKDERRRLIRRIRTGLCSQKMKEFKVLGESFNLLFEREGSKRLHFIL
jgi:hypothetical protein